MGGTDAGVADCARDVAEDGLDAAVLDEAVRDEGEQVGGVVERAGHVEVEGFQGCEDVGPRGRVADVSEGSEVEGVLQVVACWGVAGMNGESPFHVMDNQTRSGNTPGQFAVELADAAALEGSVYPHYLAIWNGLEEVADDGDAGSAGADDYGIGLLCVHKSAGTRCIVVASHEPEGKRGVECVW